MSSMTTVGLFGWWGASVSDTTAPTPAPTARITAIATTGFTATVDRVSGEASTTLRVQTRQAHSADAWVTRQSDATPAAGDTLVVTGLTQNYAYEWRIVEEDAAGNQADGTHGFVVPSACRLTAIKAAIKSILGAVSGLDADTIHARIRNFGGGNEADFETLFVTDVSGSSKLNGWLIEEESLSSQWTATNHFWERRDVLVIRGFYGIDDAGNSSATFDALVERIMTALNTDISIEGTAVLHETPQIRQYGHTMLGGKLCHYVELPLSVTWTQGRT